MIRAVPAVVYTVLASVVFLFQIGLLFGAPWGELTLGGRYPGRLPAKIRPVAALSALLLAAFALAVLTRAGMVLPACTAFARVGIWVVVAYSAAGVVLNSMTTSRWERILWVPVTLLMLSSSLLVALGPS